MDLTPAEAKVMRTIQEREHRRALAERRAARAADQAARSAPAKAPVGWSTKPDKKRKPSSSERAIAGNIDQVRRDWGRRHPDVAGAERALRKGRAEMLGRWDHKRQGTAETHEHYARAREGALQRLWRTGAIDAEQLHSATEIAAIAERISAGVTVKTASLETRVDTTRLGDGTFFERLGQVRREIAYSRWRSELRGPVAPVLEMIVHDVGVTIVARQHGMHNRRAKKLLIDALDLWPAKLAEACREVDEATLAAVHAGILA